MVVRAAVLDGPRPGIATASVPEPARARSRALDLVLLAALAVAVALVFGELHRALVIQSDAIFERVNGQVATTHPGREAITFSFGPFLAVMLGSMGLAALRHRIAAFAVFAAIAMTPLVQAVLQVLPTDRGALFRVAPTALGFAWPGGYLRPGLGPLWRAFGIDYGLALLPAVAIAAWTLDTDRRHGNGTRVARLVAGARKPTPAEVAGLIGALFLFVLFLHTWDTRQTLQNVGSPNLGADLVPFFPFFVLGVALARGARWRFLVLAAVPILWSTQWIPNLLAGSVHGLSMSDAHDALPYAAVVAAGALWRPIATLANGERTRAWVLVIALNALNLADMLFTRAALHSGQAVEANPFATWIGPGVKLIGVGVASALLARFRPRALVWLVLVFGAPIAWHLSGLVLDTS